MGQVKRAWMEWQENVEEMEALLADPDVHTEWDGAWFATQSGTKKSFVVANPRAEIFEDEPSLVALWQLDGFFEGKSVSTPLRFEQLPEEVTTPEGERQLHFRTTEGLFTLRFLAPTFWAATGYPSLTLGDDHLDSAVKELNQFIDSEGVSDFSELEFAIEALTGQYSRRMFDAGLWASSPHGHTTQILNLTGVRNPKNDAYNHWMNEIIFEGFREESPFDGTTITDIPDHISPMIVDILSTPIQLSERELDQLIDSPELSCVPEQIPESLFLAASLAYFWDVDFESHPDEEEPTFSEYARALVSSAPEAKFISLEDAWPEIAGYLGTLSSTRLEKLADIAAVSLPEPPSTLNPERIEQRLRHIADSMRWIRHRDSLGTDFEALAKRGSHQHIVTATNTDTGLSAKFVVRFSDEPTIEMSPQLPQHLPNYVDSLHEEGDCLVWRPRPDQLNTVELDLNHWLIQVPDMIASLVVETLRRSHLFDPRTLSWSIS